MGPGTGKLGLNLQSASSGTVALDKLLNRIFFLLPTSELERGGSVCATCQVGGHQKVAAVVMNNVWGPRKGCHCFDARFCTRSSTPALISS